MLEIVFHLGTLEDAYTNEIVSSFLIHHIRGVVPRGAGGALPDFGR